MLTKSDFQQISSIVKFENKSLEGRLGKKLDKLDKATNFLDRDYIKLLERVERTEEHLHLTPSS